MIKSFQGRSALQFYTTKSFFRRQDEPDQVPIGTTKDVTAVDDYDPDILKSLFDQNNVFKKQRLVNNPTFNSEDPVEPDQFPIDTAVDDYDPDFLKSIFDQNNVFKKRRPVNNATFISEDPQKNLDNNDPLWDGVKELKTDDRKQYSMEAFW
jgi:hypothetical protein